MNIETKRLLLREMTPADHGALYTVLSDPDTMRHYPYAFDEKRVQNWIERNMERYRILGFGLWAVCLKDTGEMIGDCGLTMQLIGGVIRPEIGYHIRKDMQRKGYATEAAAAVRDWTFTHTTFQEIYSYMKYTNEPSARTAMAYGCRFVEEYADEVNERTKVYAITRTEWEQRKREESMGSHVEVRQIPLTGDAVRQLIDLSSMWAAEGCSNGIVENTREDIREPVFAALDGDRIVGYAFGHAYTADRRISSIPAGSACFEVDELYVLPACRSQGIGKRLFDAIEAYAGKNAQYLTLVSCTKDYRKVLHFYAVLGGMSFHDAFLTKKLSVRSFD